METIFMNTGNIKADEPHKFVLNLSQRLDLRNSNKRVALQNLSIYYTLENIRKQYKNNRLKIIAPTWNDESELPDGSYSASDILNYIKYIIKNHDKLTAVSPIHVYTNRINNTLIFKTKDGYTLELQTPETMKLFGCKNKLIGQTNNREEVPSL